MAMILVTHDLGVVAGRTDEVIVMYAGQVVEKAPTETLFAHMKMPYTEALLRSIPKVTEPSHTKLAAIPGRPPDLVNLPHRLPVRRPLRVRAGQVPRRAASARAVGITGARVPLLVPRRHHPKARRRPQPGRPPRHPPSGGR